MPKVSVIIPTYNCAKYLSEALDSVLKQTYQDFEIIVVDDGSIDETHQIIKAYLKKYPQKIKYLYQDNRGVSAARNKGIREAQGEYIAFLDADDIWISEKLQKQSALLENNNELGFVYCDNYFTDEERKLISDYVRKNKTAKGNITADLFCDNFIMLPSVVMRKRCFERIGLFNERLLVGEDYDFLLRLAYSYEAEAIEEKLWERRVRNGSLSRKDFILDAKNDISMLTSFLIDKPDFYRKYRQRILTRLAEYHFTFAYQCLEKGINSLAFYQLLKALYYKPSMKILKNAFACFIPYSIRKSIRKSIKNIYA